MEFTQVESRKMHVNKKDDLYFEYYLVAFVDILGQQEDLIKMQNLPGNEKQHKRFIEAVKRTVLKVEFVRDSFSLYFQKMLEQKSDTSLIPTRFKNQFIATLENPNIFSYGFSDSFIIALPLSKINFNQLANGVHSTLTAVCGIGLLSLIHNLPLRAGLDVGLACKIYKTEIYGPALASAYSLENKIAEYPRFVVGEGLRDFLLCYENKKCKNLMDEVARNTINRCSNYVITDSDDVYMLDYLGDAIKKEFDNEFRPNDIRKAWEFINTECKRFSEIGNYKLYKRYSRLKKYFQSKKDVWGLALE
jgi:hypothetical protein